MAKSPLTSKDRKALRHATVVISPMDANLVGSRIEVAVERIIARHVAAALTAAADEIEKGPHRLGHDVSVLCSCLRCKVTKACAHIVRNAGST